MRTPVFARDQRLPVRHYSDAGQHWWSVCQGTLKVDGDSTVVLLFESARSYRVVRGFPGDWNVLSSAELATLSERAEIQEL